jgi:hypothetical protein
MASLGNLKRDTNCLTDRSDAEGFDWLGPFSLFGLRVVKCLVWCLPVLGKVCSELILGKMALNKIPRETPLNESNRNLGPHLRFPKDPLSSC